MPRHIRVVLFLVACLLGCLSPVVSAQQAPTEAAETSTLVSIEVLEAKVKEVEASQGMDEAMRTRISEIYSKVRSHLETIESFKSKADGFAQARETAGGDAKQIRELLDQRKRVPPWVELGVDDSTPLDDLEPRLLKEKADLAAVDARFQDLKQQLQTETGRPDQVRTRLIDARKRQAELSAELKLQPPEGENAVLTQARAWRLEAHGRSLSAEIQMLDAELLSQPSRVELLKAQVNQQRSRVEHLSGRVRYLEDQASARRKAQADEARQQAVVAQRQAKLKHPLLGEVAARNAELSDTLTSLTAELERVSTRDDQVKAAAEAIDKDFRNARQELEIAGLSQALGQVLLQKLRELPSPRRLEREAQEREQATADASLRQLKHTTQRQTLRYVDERATTMVGDLLPDEAEAIRDELQALLKDQRDMLDRLLSVDAAFLKALRELEVAQTSLATSVEEFHDFLGERLLWTRSAPTIGIDVLTGLIGQGNLLFDPEGWKLVATQLLMSGPYTPLIGFGLVLVFLGVLMRARLREMIRATGASVGNVRNDRFSNTLKALGLTVLLAALGPGLMALIGWQLAQVAGPDQFSFAVAEVLLWLSPVYFHLRVFRIVCLKDGLAALHFRWPKEGVKRLRRELGLLMWTFLPIGFLTGTAVVLDFSALGGSWGRIGVIAMMLLLAGFGWRLFRRRDSAVAPFIEWAPDSLLARWRWLWLALSIGLPLAMVGLAVVGYSYSVVTLSGDLLDTVWLVIALVIVHQLALRWLLISRRRIALRIALEKREARRAAAQREASGGDSEVAPADELKVDVVALSQESRKLVNLALSLAGLATVWAIWQDVLPAFAVLEEVNLWSRTVVEGGEEKLVAVTLGDLTLALLVVIITVLAVKRLPALVELLLLELFRMDPGGRYTVTTLTGYVLGAGGSLYALALIGADWSKLQWLVAALGVGIGFGLQEIVANFISGLIILFERPIRVGDVVTVGDVDGTVTRIRIRATTIRNWDNKELLVPNKEFITSRLLNWSLSDSTTRVLVRVGIAYGSDVRTATALMLEAAHEHEAVLEEPRASVIFEAFGDSALAMVLRCFVGELDQRVRTLSDLNEAINDKFQAAGINIAFPQQDVHLDVGGPLEVRLTNTR